MDDQYNLIKTEMKNQKNQTDGMLSKMSSGSANTQGGFNIKRATPNLSQQPSSASTISPSAQMADLAGGVGTTGFSTDRNWQGATSELAQSRDPLSYENARRVLLEHALTSPDRNYAVNSILKHLGKGDKQKVLDLANTILGGYRQNTLKDQMFSEAEQFRKDLPGIAGEQSGLLEKQGQAAIDQGTKDIRKGYSSRGLLYSGLRQGAESSLRGQVASELASGRAQLNRELEDLARAKEYEATKYGLQGYEEARQRYENLYNQQMQNALERRRRVSQIGGAVGYLAGSYLGSKPEQAQMDTGPGIETTGQSYTDYSGIA